MVRKCSCIVCAICMMMAMGVKVKATNQVGTLQVIPTWCEQPIAEGMVSVSWVGMKTEDGVLLTDGLANWYVDEGALRSEDWISWLAQHTEGKKQLAAVCSEFGAVFENLEAGIYLVEQTESSKNHMPFSSFLQSIPDQGSWNMTIRPKLIYSGESPKTADRPAPIIGAMGLGLSAAILMVLLDGRKK